MNIINLTPHTLNFPEIDLEIESAGEARVEEIRETIDPLQITETATLPICKVKYGFIEGLPAPAEDTIYIVSRLVLNALQAQASPRIDVFAPNTIRDEDGRIIGAKGLVQLSGRKMSQEHAFKYAVSFERSTRNTGMGAYDKTRLYSLAQQKELRPHFNYSSATGNHGVDKWSLLPGRYIAASVSYSNSGKGGWTLYSVIVRKPEGAKDDPNINVHTPAEKKEMPDETAWESPNTIETEPLENTPEWLIPILPDACKTFLFPEPHA